MIWSQSIFPASFPTASTSLVTTDYFSRTPCTFLVSSVKNSLSHPLNLIQTLHLLQGPGLMHAGFLIYEIKTNLTSPQEATGQSLNLCFTQSSLCSDGSLSGSAGSCFAGKGSIFVSTTWHCMFGVGEGVKCKALSKLGAALTKMFTKHDDQTWHDKHVTLSPSAPSLSLQGIVLNRNSIMLIFNVIWMLSAI